MDFRQLENFVEVCEQVSFTKAANNLYISQQGVSKSIKSLEDELGVQLVFRKFFRFFPMKSAMVIRLFSK